MGEQDDLDKLLREIDAMNARQLPAPQSPQPGAVTPATRSAGEVSRTGQKGTVGGRWAWTGVSAVGAGLAGGVLGTVLTLLPSMGTLSTAVGAAIGGALVGFVSGPPRWFDQE